MHSECCKERNKIARVPRVWAAGSFTVSGPVTVDMLVCRSGSGLVGCQALSQTVVASVDGGQ